MMKTETQKPGLLLPPKSILEWHDRYKVRPDIFADSIGKLFSIPLCLLDERKLSELHGCQDIFAVEVQAGAVWFRAGCKQAEEEAKALGWPSAQAAQEHENWLSEYKAWLANILLNK